MNDYLITTCFIAFLLFALFFVRRFRPSDFFEEKKRYIDARGDKNYPVFQADIFHSYPDSQMYRNNPANGDVVKLNSTLSWQELRFQNAGPFIVKCDSLFFTDKKYVSMSFFSSTFLRALFDSDPSPPKDVMVFCEKFDLNIESGYFGAVLVRERKTMKAEEVDEIISEFMKLDFAKK